MVKVSVIVPVYNTEKYVSECLESILSQSYRDFEVIIIDDGSTDNSNAICKKYADSDKRVKMYSIRNSGPAGARNFGIQHSTGEYITFIDSDDVITKNCLQRMADLVTKYNADICTTNYLRLNSEIITERENIDELFSAEIVIDDALLALKRYIELNDYNIRSPVAKLIRSTIVKNHLFPTNRVWSEDTAAVYLWYYDSDKIIELKDRLYIYRFNAMSISHTRNYDITFQEFMTWDEQLMFFKNNNLKEHFRLLNLKYNISIIRYMKMILDDNNLGKTEKRKYLLMLRKRLKKSLLDMEEQDKGFFKHPIAYSLSDERLSLLYIGIRKIRRLNKKVI